ncbi:hypothetical protein DL89DRAFT_294936 [Linderina pennispora]|uniref:CCHC-type domain-containing protein n=1 Tax=Linderina pennispora TaxID=61395 RepID=A0A1Y1W0X8_9FUNG|nr:uncharacterized protein DL89DRAFT_294936 [Linderina pennispora]ORX67160.1 hypothetical protein DL89DRAFT_294936 [Linderina pennispora]
MSNSNAQPVKVLVTGSVNGGLADFFGKIKKLDAKYGPFAVLFITGNLLDSDPSEDEVNALLSNDIPIPLMTYAIIGDHRLPERVLSRIEARSGEVCQNLVLLKNHGILQTSEGMKVAYLSGQQQPELQQPEDNSEDNNEYEAADDSDEAKVATMAESNECTYTNQDMGDLLKQVVVENNVTAETTGPHPSIDILLTFDWPYGIGPDQPEPEHASNKISFISATTKPRYHFAASEGTFFERQPYKYSDKIKWFYAMNIMPLQSSNCGDTSPSQVPENSTENPHRAHFPSSNGIMNREELRRIMASINLESLGAKRDGPDLKRQKGAPPPLDYTCNICKVGGHWIRDCPERHQAERKPRSEIPPEGARTSTSRMNLINIAQTCWFCLSNPNVDQNLIVAIGDEAYVAMAKGPLVTGPAGVQSGNSTAWEQGEVSPIPGGGHAMIVPIEHVLAKWTQSLTALYAEYDCVPLMFESNYPRDKKDGYVWVSTPTTGAKPTCVKIPAKEKRFNLQIGSRARFPDKEEARQRDAFIKVFSKHDFMSGKD